MIANSSRGPDLLCFSGPDLAGGAEAALRISRKPMRQGAALMVGPPVLMLALGWFLGLGMPKDGEAAPPQPPTGQAIGGFSLPPLAGENGGLAETDLRGKVSVVNFWASWCQPCREEMPLLQELAAVPGVTLFGINSRDRPAAARRFLSVAGDPFARIGTDPDGAVAKAWGVYGLPATFVVTAEGRVAHALIGPLDRDLLEREILPLLAGPSPAR